MPTRLRLARFGCKRRPFYRIVATDSRKWRDGKPTEYVSFGAACLTAGRRLG